MTFRRRRAARNAALAEAYKEKLRRQSSTWRLEEWRRSLPIAGPGTPGGPIAAAQLLLPAKAGTGPWLVDGIWSEKLGDDIAAVRARFGLPPGRIVDGALWEELIRR
jgi:hypothetical protein